MQLPVWDLSALYACPGDWEQDFERLTALAENFFACKGRLSSDIPGEFDKSLKF